MANLGLNHDCIGLLCSWIFLDFSNESLHILDSKYRVLSS